MKPEHRDHLVHYLVLFLILLAGFVFFLYFRYQPTRQFIVITIVDLLYLTWGLVHHYLEDRLNWGVVSEYFLVGTVALLAFGLTLVLR